MSLYANSSIKTGMGIAIAFISLFYTQWRREKKKREVGGGWGGKKKDLKARESDSSVVCKTRCKDPGTPLA